MARTVGGLAAVYVLTLLCAFGQFTRITAAATMNTSTYTNPILNKIGADPFVIRYQDYYLMLYTTNDNITMLKSDQLTDWNNASTKLVFDPPPGTNYSYSLWAPELHSFTTVNGTKKWYIIFTANRDDESPKPEEEMYCTYNCPALHHRMFVLESSSSTSGTGGGEGEGEEEDDDPWESEYTMKSELDTFDQFALDGTFFIPPSSSSSSSSPSSPLSSSSNESNPEIYHIYSCWNSKYESWPANLCIQRMDNPWTISSSAHPLFPSTERPNRLTISSPTNPWEKTPYNRTINSRLSSNEGPQQLTNPHTGQTFVVYSAARSDNRNYCLGLIEFNPQNLPDVDPMAITSWVKNDKGCVFEQNPAEEVYGVGHASFTTSPDGQENWIVYHGMRDPTDGWAARTIRTQRFEWDRETGWPVFPQPAYGPFEVPGGE